MTFDDWRDWCRTELRFEQEFACVWLGLGIWQAVLDGEGREFVPPRALPEDGIARQIAGYTGRGNRIPWRFPTAEARLRAFPPSAWLAAVLHADRTQPSAEVWRIKLIDEACPGQQRLWRMPMVRIGLRLAAVSADIDGRDAELRLGWPLRIGYFADNKPAGCLDNTAPGLTIRYALGRDQSKCDLLVFWGTAGALIERVRANPGHIKANLLWLIDPDPASAGTLEELRQLARASGLVILDQANASARIDLAINAFLEEFSHDRRCDAALELGVEQHIRISVIALSEELARARISDLADVMRGAGPRALPQAAPPPAAAPPAATPPPPAPAPPSAAPPPPRMSAPPPPPPAAHPGILERSIQVLGRIGKGITSPFKHTRALPTIDSLVFDQASGGASVLAELATAAAAEAEPQPAERFLQQQSFVLPDGQVRRPAEHGFVAGMVAEVDIRIGPQQAGWQGLPDAFPDAGLFTDSNTASLTVWLTEPGQLAAPVSAKLVLPRDGASAPCILRFTPGHRGPFEGRISVLHHGRVLQTALLTADVSGEAAPVLQKITPVRHNLGDVQARRYFDLAFVENHTLAGVPRTVALSSERAWIADASALIDHMAEISAPLAAVAESVADYADGIEGEEGKAVLIDLARSGSSLCEILFGEQLERPGNHAAIAHKEYIQIVSMRSETLPIEFAYDFPAPARDAALCEHWRDGVSAGQCPGTCGGGTRQRVCPMGFWGLSKVIERHQLSYEHSADGKQYFLQSEPTRLSDTISVVGPVVFSGSERVGTDGIGKVRAALASVPGVEAVLVKDWTQWASEVAARNPRMIVSMPHTAGTNREVSLEISAQTIASLDLTEDHVCPQPDGHPPVVILLGCDVAAATAAFSRHVSVFNRKGAAVVVATIATVAGTHAAAVAALLSAELLKKRDEPFRIGEAIRAVKRQALLQNLIMPLCIVAYGDADWRIETNGEQHDDV